MQTSFLHARGPLLILMAASAFAWVGPMSSIGLAYESDQFTLRRRHIVDSGETLSRVTYEKLESTLQLINHEISRVEAEAAKFRKQRNRKGLKARGDLLRVLTSESYLAEKVCKNLGSWMKPCSTDDGVKLPVRVPEDAYIKPDYGNSIYASTRDERFLVSLRMSGTLRLYGIYVGADKLEHLFDQGFEYLERYLDAERRGRSEERRLARANQKGTQQEEGWYGWIPSGNVSNGDLAANYAGLKFYLNLTRTVQIAGTTHEPRVLLENQRWRMNPDYSIQGYMRPFITEHLNEALNPSLYVESMRGDIRNAIRKQCKRWLSLHPEIASKEIAEAKLENLKTWHGEEYGHQGRDHGGLKPEDALVTIANTCF